MSAIHVYADEEVAGEHQALESDQGLEEVDQGERHRLKHAGRLYDVLAPPFDIPTLGTWGLIAFVLALAGLALPALRRRGRQAASET